MKRWLKIKIAWWIDNLFPNRYCWSALVDWSMLDGEFPSRHGVERCKGLRDKESGYVMKDGFCYCGKFRHGKLYKGEEVTE